MGEMVELQASTSGQLQLGPAHRGSQVHTELPARQVPWEARVQVHRDWALASTATPANTNKQTWCQWRLVFNFKEAMS